MSFNTPKTTTFAAPETVTVQFGNPGDTSGYEVTNATLVASQQRMAEVFLVRKEGTNLYGNATFDTRKNRYYCTSAMELGGVFRGRAFTAEDLARHLGWPVELFV